MEKDQQCTIQDPSALDILRYRYHHGTNLGSIYVLERWIHPSMFPDSITGSSELEAVRAWVDIIGMDATREKFEQHWANAVSDADITWLLQQAKGILPPLLFVLCCSLRSLGGSPILPRTLTKVWLCL
jgi:hypothetical protein